MTKINLFAEINKVDEDQRLVYGYASTEALDWQGERVSKAAIQDALPDYLKFSNIREMHQASAVGVAEEATVDDKGLYLVAKVVDDNAWKKVKEGVYKGFSIGGKCLAKMKDTITKLKLTEISLVDRPANPEAVFEMYKFDDGEEKINTENKNNDAKKPVSKGMYAVANLAELLASLNALKESATWEAEIEGDNSSLPAKLKSAVENLGQILREMVDEEVSELTEGNDVENTQKTEDLSKKEDGQVQTDLTKQMSSMNEMMQKMLDQNKQLMEQNAELAKRVNQLEAKPASEKQAYANDHGVKTITKMQDTGSNDDDLQAQIDAENDTTEKTVLMIKQIHRSGGTPVLF